MTDTAGFPPHGRLTCAECFTDSSPVRSVGKWKMRRDPGSWGAQHPRYLVLGFSKGATQTDIYATGRFDDVAFGGDRTRQNLTDILRRVGLLPANQTVDARICAGEREFHFSSLVRCSLARLDEKAYAKDGREKYITSGSLITKSFSEVPQIINTCTTRFLGTLPESLKLIVVMGVTDSYIRCVRETMKRLHPAGFRTMSDVAYKNDKRLWVHLTHPSKGNGTLNAWLNGDVRSNASAAKRELAIEALREDGFAK